jgi:hypothetical protein
MYVPQTLDYDFLKNPFSQRKWVFGEENYDIWGAEVFASAPVSAYLGCRSLCFCISVNKDCVSRD